MKELWLQLLDQRGRNRQGHKAGEESRLHVNVAVAQMPESECVEKTGEYMKHHFALE